MCEETETCAGLHTPVRVAKDNASIARFGFVKRPVVSVVAKEGTWVSVALCSEDDNPGRRNLVRNVLKLLNVCTKVNFIFTFRASGCVSAVGENLRLLPLQNRASPAFFHVT